MDNKSIQVICFAGLKKYFGNETTVSVGLGASYSALIDALKALKPEATEVLSSCRIAVNEKFVPLNEPIGNEITVFLIPPSSGG